MQDHFNAGPQPGMQAAQKCKSQTACGPGTGDLAGLRVQLSLQHGRKMRHRAVQGFPLLRGDALLGAEDISCTLSAAKRTGHVASHREAALLHFLCNARRGNGRHLR